MRLHASWSIVFFAIGVIVGDIIAFVTKSTFFIDAVWLAVSLSLLFLAIVFPRYYTMPIAVIAGILLITNLATPIFIKDNYAKTLTGREIEITGKIIKDPEEDDGKKKIYLEVPEIGKIFTTVSGIDVKRSDYITISGVLSEGFGNFAGTIYHPEVKEIIYPEPGDLFLRFRDFFAKGIKDNLPEKEAGLASGYLLGQRTGVDKSFQDSLRTVGLTHIIVASGAHLGILISIARKIFGRLSRFASFLSGGIATLLFIGVTGLSASMMRAGLVVGISLITWYFGRKIHPARLILLVAALTLIFSPEFLVDFAWQLSFASFSGILIVAPIISNFFYGEHKKPGFIASTIISSISATLLCLPILLYYYGSISVISILVNLLILPTVSIAMGLTFLTGLSALILPLLTPAFGFLNKLVLDYQIVLVEFFGAKREFLLELPSNNPLYLLLYIPVLTIIIYWTVRTKKDKTKRLRLHSSDSFDTLGLTS